MRPCQRQRDALAGFRGVVERGCQFDRPARILQGNRQRRARRDRVMEGCELPGEPIMHRGAFAHDLFDRR